MRQVRYASRVLSQVYSWVDFMQDKGYKLVTIECDPVIGFCAYMEER